MKYHKSVETTELRAFSMTLSFILFFPSLIFKSFAFSNSAFSFEKINFEKTKEIRKKHVTKFEYKTFPKGLIFICILSRPVDVGTKELLQSTLRLLNNQQ